MKMLGAANRSRVIDVLDKGVKTVEQVCQETGAVAVRAEAIVDAAGGSCKTHWTRWLLEELLGLLNSWLKNERTGLLISVINMLVNNHQDDTYTFLQLSDRLKTSVHRETSTSETIDGLLPPVLAGKLG